LKVLAWLTTIIIVALNLKYLLDWSGLTARLAQLFH